MADMIQFLTRVTEEQSILIERTYLENPMKYKSRAAVVRAALDCFLGREVCDMKTYKSPGYEPTCKFGYDDCVNDPAYLRHTGYYGKIYTCNCCTKGECYDDEDK